MAIQYAGGTIVNATLTQAAGTRAELAQWIRDQLVAAGWTSAGTATDYQVTSALTPQSLQGRVRVYDPGSGSCARLKFSNVAGTKTQAGDLFLLPAVGKSWRVVANKHQFFAMTPGGSVAREFACGGVPYLPAFLTGVITEGVWGAGLSRSDTDVSVPDTFRSRLSFSVGSPGNQFGLCNGNIMETTNAGVVAGIGMIRLVCPIDVGMFVTTGYLWHDGSQLLSDPLLAWGLTTYTDRGDIRGQLWDAVVLSDSWGADVTLQPDPANPTYNFLVVTNNNSGTAGSQARGALCVRTS